MASYYFSFLELLVQGALAPNPFSSEFSNEFGSGPPVSGSATLLDTAAVSENLTVSSAGLALADTVSSVDALVNAGTTYVNINPFTTDFSVDFGGGSASIPGSYPLSDYTTSSEAYVVVGGVGLSFSDSASSSDFYGFPLKFTMSDSTVSSDSFTAGTPYVATLVDFPAITEILSEVLGTVPFSLTDSALSADVYTISNARITLTTDTVVTSDLLQFGQLQYTGSFADSATTADIFAQLAYLQALHDSAVTNESIASNLTASYNPWTSDFSVDFGSGGATTSGETQSDTLSSVDVLSATFNTSVSLFDSAVCTEFLATPVFATQSDSASITEVYAPFLGVPIALADFINGSESLQGALPFLASDNDFVTSNEILSFVVGSAVGLTDSAATSDAYGTTYTRLGTLNDTAVTSESLTAVFTIASTTAIGDTAATSDFLNLVIFTSGLTDSASEADAYTVLNNNAPVSLSDSAASSDLLGIVARQLSPSDNVGTGDVLTPLGGSTPSVTDATAVSSDAYAITLIAYAATLGDIATATEIFALPGQLFATRTDSAASSDSLTVAVLADIVSLTDTAASSDLVSSVAFGATLADSAVTFDNFSAINYSMSLANSAVLSDSFTATFNLPFAFADFMFGTDALVTLALSISIGDTAFTSDALTAVETSATVSLSDSVASNELLTPVRGFPSALADILADSDTIGTASLGYSLGYGDATFSSEAWSNTGLSTVNSVTAMGVPTGGAVLLQFPGFYPLPLVDTTLTIERSVLGSNDWVTIYDGPPIGVFLDVGDSLPAPLDGTIQYVWQVSDGISSAIVGPINPISSFVNEPDQLTQILIRALQGAIDNMVLPPGVGHVVVTTKMPMNGWQAMPFIVVNLDLIQQTETAIGEDMINPDPTNVWTLFANARRVWRITVISQDAEERDFYRDSLLAVFRILKATAFGPIGFDVSHTFSASSYTNATEWEGMNPGFYGADLLLEINGVFPAVVLTNYPVILAVASNPTFDPNLFTESVYP